MQIQAQTYKGHFEMLQEAKQEIDTYGPNPGLIGTEIPAEVGRAIALLQAAGIAEMGPFVKIWKHWKLRVYRKTWCTIQRFWEAPRWIRVTDNEEMAQFIQVNGWEKDENGFPVAINQLAALDVDIIVDHGTDAVTTMQDTYEALQVMAKGGTPIPPEIIVEMSGLPSKVKQSLMAKFEQQKNDPMQQQAVQAQLNLILAQIADLQSKAQLNQAKAMTEQIEAQKPPEPQQIDTPADLAKANLDAAKAREIDHKIQVGHHIPEQRQPPPVEPGLFDVNAAKAAREHAASRREDAQSQVASAQAVKTLLEAKTIMEAPPGMLTNPPPRPPGGAPGTGRR